jgi:hypothetical protein
MRLRFLLCWFLECAVAVWINAGWMLLTEMTGEPISPGRRLTPKRLNATDVLANLD